MKQIIPIGVVAAASFQEGTCDLDHVREVSQSAPQKMERRGGVGAIGKSCCIAFAIAVDGRRSGTGSPRQRRIEPRRASWRMLTLGSTVWAPFGDHGWRPGIIVALGKNRGDRTVVHLKFETGGKGTRVAGELYWRKAELKGKDKPKPASELSLEQST